MERLVRPREFRSRPIRRRNRLLAGHSRKMLREKSCRMARRRNSQRPSRRMMGLDANIFSRFNLEWVLKS